MIYGIIFMCSNLLNGNCILDYHTARNAASQTQLHFCDRVVRISSVCTVRRQGVSFDLIMKRKKKDKEMGDEETREGLK